MPDQATASYCNSCTSVIKISLWENIAQNGFFSVIVSICSFQRKLKKKYMKCKPLMGVSLGS